MIQLFQMSRIIVASLLLLASASAEFKDRTINDFHEASELCFKRLRIQQSYKSKFENFDYPNEPIVHRYLHCVWLDLALWDDRTGFHVEHLAQVYRDKANPEILVPILSDCNRNKQNDPPAKWLYRAFKCILDSRVGDWFKENVTKQAG